MHNVAVASIDKEMEMSKAIRPIESNGQNADSDVI